VNDIQKKRIDTLKNKMFSEERYISIEQALITTNTYRENQDKPVIIKRALSLKNALENIEISIEPEELIVGNRTKGVRAGVITPEAGSSWVDKELDTLPTRPQDKFKVHPGDAEIFRREIAPYWRGKSLEDVLNERYGDEINQISMVVKINQTDHAQGHICPDCSNWLRKGPAGLKQEAEFKIKQAEGDKKNFYESIILVMNGTINFMKRYEKLLLYKAQEKENEKYKEDMIKVAGICNNLSHKPPETFHEAVQSIWFLFVILHMESNASSFSPGRMDMYLYPYFKKDMEKGILDEDGALEILECLYLKFNQIVYLRNANSAKYFAGFPIGFNIAIGGQDENGNDFSNELSHLFLQAQEDLLLPQPNLSLRLHKGTNDKLLKHAIRVVAKGSGMPQFFNDEAIIDYLIKLGIDEKDARNYAIVGCVELTTQGNYLGWSDAGMFNFNKVLELTLNNGICLITGKKLSPDFGNLTTYNTYEELEDAFRKNIDYFTEKLIAACEQVEKAHMDILPSPFLSSVINNCMENGTDVTAGGAKYNLSGIQMIQIANLADSLAAIREMVYKEKRVSREELLKGLRTNFENQEALRTALLNKVEKYGNDVDWVDEIGVKWAAYFREKLSGYTNYRGGPYHTGMYTVSAHVPMGQNVGATPDGRLSQQPLADGGLSPVYGRDVSGPTAVLKSVSKIDCEDTTNGGLLNMKFLPEFFSTETGIDKFSKFLRTFVDLKIPHIQFNVVRREDLIAAQKEPEKYRSLTVRVAGYTAYFTELAGDLQNEIIARTTYSDI
jgi:pyruvate formate-lyase/glycerol dehydratase family glycyl radical enzyme